MNSLRGKLGWLPPIPHHGYILRDRAGVGSITISSECAGTLFSEFR